MLADKKAYQRLAQRWQERWEGSGWLKISGVVYPKTFE